MPAPTTHTSACTSSASGERALRPAVSIQSEASFVMRSWSPSPPRGKPRRVCRTCHGGQVFPVRAPGKLAAALAACVAVAGCGASGQPDDVAAVAARFHAALARGDAALACAQLAPQTLAKLEQQERRPCAQAILDAELPGGARPADTSVYVTTATVELEHGGRMFLDRFEDGWKVSAAGCRPAGADLPYDCELGG
jgi:hypothetical protein